MLYMEIHQLIEKKFSLSEISKMLKISRNTVYKYKEMTLDDAVKWHHLLTTRKKKLDPYKDWILAWLEEFAHLTAAQIKDWLLERYPDLQIGDSTVRIYVKNLREEYQITKNTLTRQYEAVEETPMGSQAQVDWGETTQQTLDKKEEKLHFINFVLSHSRYKYVEWQDRPFTTSDTIRCHENAFQYFGGIPIEMVYDQDRLITVDENAGDLILTQEFQAYKQEQGFYVRLCRKADPEPKGKIENVVKYVKYNFADSRTFSSTENWNERSLEWLTRTANHQVHQTTKKRPDEVFLIEKQHLQPVSSPLLNESSRGSNITRIVHKDSTIKYESNRYSVPLGSYQPSISTHVTIEIDQMNRIIRQ